MRYDQMKMQRDALKEELDAANQTLAELRTSNGKLRNQLRQELAAADADKLRTERNDWHSRYLEAIDERDSARAQRDSSLELSLTSSAALRTARDEARIERDKLKGTLDAARVEMANLKAHRDDLEGKLGAANDPELRTERDELRAHRDQLKDTLIMSDKASEVTETRRRALQAELGECKDELRAVLLDARCESTRLGKRCELMRGHCGRSILHEAPALRWTDEGEDPSRLSDVETDHEHALRLYRRGRDMVADAMRILSAMAEPGLAEAKSAEPEGARIVYLPPGVTWQAAQAVLDHCKEKGGSK